MNQIIFKTGDGMKNRTKAQMLKYLKENLAKLNILPLYILSSHAYFQDKAKSLIEVREYIDSEYVIVRSSSKNEDTLHISNAGKFKSVLNVLNNNDGLAIAIEDVYKSYNTDQDEEILIQPMVNNIKKSGVVFTADMDTYAPYYIVNYSEGSESDSVTSGETNDLKTFIAYKYSPVAIEDSDMRALIQICREIEVFLQESALDIEFAIDALHNIYILQVRAIAVGYKTICDRLNLDKPLEKIYKKIIKLNKSHPFLLGDKTCFGVMPDWNPAEILGVRPGKLAVTLYKELITDNIWAHQRSDYGYRDLTMHPLMVLFCGIPYIDTRITFNSFVPKKLNDKIANKLVNYYLSCLENYPTYHDKIEFNIVYSCYYLGLPQKLKKLLNYGFNENEIKRIEFSLLEITNKIIHPEKGLYKTDLEKIGNLNINYEKIVSSDISTIDKIYWLIENCKLYGTLPFAGVARAGFIAVQFLKSFVEMNIITKIEYSNFMNSLNTINTQLRNDLKKLKLNQITKKEFEKKYGHIRPGTYDIMSLRYDEDFDYYFGDYKIDDEFNLEKLSLTNLQLEKIQIELEQNGLEINAKQLLSFIIEAIEGREYVKFAFTRSVSEILKLIGCLGERLSIEKQDLAYLDIMDIKQLYSDLYYDDLKKVLLDSIEKNKRQYQYAKQIKLPSLIIEPHDIYNYYLLDEEPNFIGMKKVRGEIVLEHDINKISCQGKIVFIQAADPGYDFLFSKGIKGLVTQFGGVNSHMAIRCAELGIAAVIGAGEKNYDKWIKYSKIEIDCLRRTVLPTLYI